LDYLVYWANRDTVLLSKEVQLLKNYLDLEKLRYGDKLQITSHLNLQNEAQKIAPLLLLPFVENCFKHGRVGIAGIFLVEIELKTTEGFLTFNIKNSKKNVLQHEPKNGGLGLKNIKKRLQLIYPNQYQLDIKDKIDSFEIRLQIDLRK